MPILVCKNFISPFRYLRPEIVFHTDIKANGFEFYSWISQFTSLAFYSQVISHCCYWVPSLVCGMCKIDTAGMSVYVPGDTLPTRGGLPDACRLWSCVWLRHGSVLNKMVMKSASPSSTWGMQVISKIKLRIKVVLFNPDISIFIFLRYVQKHLWLSYEGRFQFFLLFLLFSRTW